MKTRNTPTDLTGATPGPLERWMLATVSDMAVIYTESGAFVKPCETVEAAEAEIAERNTLIEARRVEVPTSPRKLRDVAEPGPIPPAHDPVNYPSHYTSSNATCSGCGKPIECIDVAQHWIYPLGAALKYMWRNGLKADADAIEDLRKAIQYLQFEIRRLGGEV